MAFVEIHSEYRDMLARLGLAKAEDFLHLPGVVCCGHPDRNVSRVAVGEIPAFLKKEHRTRWRDRFANSFAGFGWATKSTREFALLTTLKNDGIGCPAPIACGEDSQGRAFLLVRDLQQGVELRHYLQRLDGKNRGTVARQLGAAVARFHKAGYVHGDLYAKHVLVDDSQGPEQLQFCFLDWQRGRKIERVGMSARWRDLATLDATIAEDLLPRRERFEVLRAYLECGDLSPLFGGRNRGEHSVAKKRRQVAALQSVAYEIQRRSQRLLQRRRIREMRQPPMLTGKQNLIWVDGEALQVTREYQRELSTWKPPEKGTGLFFDTMTLPGKRIGHLASRLAYQPLRSFWCWLRRKPLIAPEVDSMKVLFRLERYGVVTPKLVAVGQKQIKPWTIQSFLLTEPLQNALPLSEFLGRVDTRSRRAVIRNAARTLRQMHQATCYVEPQKHTQIGELLSVTSQAGVALSTVHGIEKSHHPNPVRAQRDLAALVQALTGHCSRSDLLRGLLAYTGQKRLSFAGKLFARRVLSRLAMFHRQRRVAA
ncbi:MAG TPA: lipopolysaccharide kinase InaA family protein [Gemmataceae bacterium]|nr:lipopolysaccharide kinase InaA family protein [Gemmataceae bacterium]